MWDLFQSKNEKMDWDFSTIKDVKEVKTDQFLGYLNRCWNPQLNVIGQDGIPPIDIAGNVLRPYTTYRLSFRIPPNLNIDSAFASLIQEISNAHILYKAELDINNTKKVQGQVVQDFDKQFENILSSVGKEIFNQDTMYYCEGASIPFV